jgi:hypothetical protein
MKRLHNKLKKLLAMVQWKRCLLVSQNTNPIVMPKLLAIWLANGVVLEIEVMYSYVKQLIDLMITIELVYISKLLKCIKILSLIEHAKLEIWSFKQ